MKNFLSTLKGKIIAGAVTLAVIAAAVGVGVSLNRGYRTICVDELNGVTTVTALETVSEVFKGQNLQSGSAVAVGENADLTLALDTDKHVYAKELTKFRLEATGAAGKDSKTLIKLEKGSVLSRIDEKLQTNESYVVESPNSLIAVRGTTFNVTVFYDEDGVCHTIVEVAEGNVEIIERDENGNLTGEVRNIGEGESIEVTEGGLFVENVPEFADEEELEDVADATTAPLKEEFITIKGETYSTLLTELMLHSRNLTDEDIKPLEKMINLKSLNLGNNKISDISVLKKLTNLKELDLSANNISDISALGGLINLTSLDLAANKISDISALSELKNLEFARLYSNQISDISALSGLTKLGNLFLAYNQISDINALSELNNLTWLSLSGNQISDISVLKKLTKLEILTLDDHQISDISALSELNNLILLNLNNNQISDISALSGLTKLGTLYLENNQISEKDIEDLKKALPKCSIVS